MGENNRIAPKDIFRTVLQKHFKKRLKNRFFAVRDDKNFLQYLPL